MKTYGQVIRIVSAATGQIINKGRLYPLSESDFGIVFRSCLYSDGSAEIARRLLALSLSCKCSFLNWAKQDTFSLLIESDFLARLPDRTGPSCAAFLRSSEKNQRF